MGDGGEEGVDGEVVHEVEGGPPRFLVLLLQEGLEPELCGLEEAVK